jgi:hypothetical protein
MADNHDLLTCPLCEGHGEIRLARLLELVENREIMSLIDSCLAKACDSSDSKPEQVETTVGSSTERNFQEDVHSWNPQLPMWRRSPKE